MYQCECYHAYRSIVIINNVFERKFLLENQEKKMHYLHNMYKYIYMYIPNVLID